MQKESVKPDKVIFPSVLNACGNLASLEEGKRIHASILKSGFETDLYVGNALVDMYAKCGSVEHARKVFDKISKRDVVSWNAIIGGYVQHGHDKEALYLFSQMECENVKPAEVTFVSVLNACAHSAALDQGKQIHSQIIRSGLESDLTVGNALIDMYAKCRSIDHAYRVFDKMSKRDAVSWNTIIGGYAQNGYDEEALDFFCQMQWESVKPTEVTFVTIISACSHLASLEQGKQIHAHIIRSGFESDVFVGSTLVDMYSKCGSIEQACQVFNKILKHDIVSWNTMIAGYAQHGCAKEALCLIEKMQQQGVKPNHVSFIGVLYACSHAGLVNEAQQCFHAMKKKNCIRPAADHYACIVDLLGRAGRLMEADYFINKMPFEPTAVVWMALLGACRIHGNADLAEHTADCVLELEPQNAAAFVLLSNIYAAANRWEDKAKVRKLMKHSSVKKEPGSSCIEVNNQVHSFLAEDSSHPQTREIYAELKRLSWQLLEAGYVPDTRHALQDVEEKQKESSVSHHSEKLALAFGIINTPSGTPIHIIKNLRVCGDCHTAIKFISKIVGREILVRDANRFHHFKGGVCSCGDYW